ncbi:hypothetical protein FRC05_005545 [Tulasnella sp. 425]|nr:hypothetical protein FRC05_005545 [Tulasnella sp. 425]
MAVHNLSRSTRPNDRLPVELLTFILNLRFPDTDILFQSRKRMAELYGLRLVSELWKELIENTPTLWTHVSGDSPMTVIQDCLRWSKNRPLQIEVYSSQFKSSEALIEYLQLLQPHSYRWKTLRYAVRQRSRLRLDESIAKNFLESPAPMLQSIYVELDKFSPAPTVNLAGGQAKTLKRLRLQDISLPWSSNLLHGLETFSLQIKGTVPAEDIINLFAKSPGLRRFELSCQGTDGQNNQTAPTGGLNTAAYSLEEAVVRTRPYIASQILSHVSMPNCRSLVLSTHFTALDDIHTLDDALVQFMPRIGEALDLGGRTTLTWSESPEFRYEWRSPSKYDAFHFSLEFSGIWIRIIMGWIRGLVAASGSQLELEVSLTTSDLEIGQAMGGLDEITKLEIVSNSGSQWDETEEAAPLLDFLGNARVDADGLSWAFSNLQELDLRPSGYGPIKVFNMFNKRFLHDAHIKALEELGLSIDPPPKLNVWVEYPNADAEVMMMTALENHWGTKSLNRVEWDDEALEDLE